MPDFLVTRGAESIYLECTLVSALDGPVTNRPAVEADIRDAIKEIADDDFLVEVKSKVVGDTAGGSRRNRSPCLSPVCRRASRRSPHRRIAASPPEANRPLPRDPSGPFIVAVFGHSIGSTNPIIGTPPRQHAKPPTRPSTNISHPTARRCCTERRCRTGCRRTGHAQAGRHNVPANSSATSFGCVTGARWGASSCTK